LSSWLARFGSYSYNYYLYVQNRLNLCSLYLCSGYAQDSNADCVTNTTPLSQLQTVNNDTAHISLLPDYVVDGNNFFEFSQWIFPGIQFNCTRNLSRIIVLGEPSQLPAPEITLWTLQVNSNNGYERVLHSRNATVSTALGDSFDEISYNFEPALEVMDGVFIGFRFMDNSTAMQVTSRRIAFRDGPSSPSIHTFISNNFIPIPPSPFVSENNTTLPLVSIEFGKSFTQIIQFMHNTNVLVCI